VTVPEPVTAANAAPCCRLHQADKPGSHSATCHDVASQNVQRNRQQHLTVQCSPAVKQQIRKPCLAHAEIGTGGNHTQYHKQALPEQQQQHGKTKQY
jgi:hypothetical protein